VRVGKAKVQNSEEELRQGHLKLILRHGILAALDHLGAGRESNYVSLTTYLITQLRDSVKMLELQAVIHLQRVMPMLRDILMDPFATAVPELLMATLDAVDGMCEVCEPRIREKWWGEALRGCVGVCCNVLDEEDGRSEKLGRLETVKSRTRDLVRRLAGIVKQEEWEDAKHRICEEEPDLEALFDGT
jgi:hypothetical protein